MLFDEGFDHVILKSRKNGKYVRLGNQGELIADADADGAEVFEKNDWDFGSWTFRSLKTGKYVTEGGGFKLQVEQQEKKTTLDLVGMNC